MVGHSSGPVERAGASEHGRGGEGSFAAGDVVGGEVAVEFGAVEEGDRGEEEEGGGGGGQGQGLRWEGWVVVCVGGITEK